MSARIEACIRDYLRRQKTYPQREVEWFKSLSFPDALKNAALAKDWYGNRFSHQYRLKSSTLEASYKSLSRVAKDIEGCRDFESLFAAIEKSVIRIRGVGELYLYDTALRIGANLRLMPKKIYLHAGTRAGAMALGIECKGRGYLTLTELPKPFRKLEPYQIEDILCIYKAHFKENGIEPSDIPSTCCIK